MIKIGIDGKPLVARGAGVARYVDGLLAGLAALPHADVEFEVVTPASPRRTLPWVLWKLQLATGMGYSVFHFPFYYPPLAPRCPVTVAIHDVLVLEHPEWFPSALVNPLRLLIPRGARRAAAVFTGSRSVADAIAERCRIPRACVHLTGYGVDRARFSPPPPERLGKIRERYGLQRPFLLQVGALEARRGTDLAIAAVASLRERYADLELVLVGEPRSHVSVLEQPPPWVRRLGWVGDADLPGLYAGASAVLAPSRGEGFDLPVLEALASGAVVVASDIPVHGEHFAAAVESFADGNAEALADAIATVLEGSERAAALRAAGPRLAAGFDWKDVACRHLELWRDVGQG
jgi:glycosyltransferase involved in cell wall biosynthesis